MNLIDLIEEFAISKSWAYQRPADDELDVKILATYGPHILTMRCYYNKHMNNEVDFSLWLGNNGGDIVGENIGRFYVNFIDPEAYQLLERAIDKCLESPEVETDCAVYMFVDVREFLRNKTLTILGPIP